MAGPTIVRAQRGAQHLVLALAHWAGGHNVSAEEITRRIVKARQEAHALAVAEQARLAQAAQKKATKLRRISERDGGLVPAQMTALQTADLEAQRHGAALSALGDFEVPALDPGHIRHRRHRIAAVRCMVLTLAPGAVIAGSWVIDGTVFLWSVLGGAAACVIRGDKPFQLGLRPVPAELLAATPLVLPTVTATVVEPEGPAADPGEWKADLRRHVERAVAIADLGGAKAVHVADLLAGLQQSGQFLGATSKTFPGTLRDAGIPVEVVKIKGESGLGVRYDKLGEALGHQPALPAHLVPDLTEDQDQEAGGVPLSKPLPHQGAATG
ncbi:hypothetical protein AB0F71_39430 [Kitasatospora sp. NPDC028055]|uniref:hypothetical protein n=1 Tax=Kitasatospora sp. NPDC028055 TaxID=3155653 RepID=UPI0033DA38D7